MRKSLAAITALVSLAVATGTTPPAAAASATDAPVNGASADTASPLASASSKTTTLVVAANSALAAAVTLPPGATVSVKANGRWCVGSPGVKTRCGDPAGIRPSETGNYNAVLPAARTGMLLGRLGSGQAFVIGERSTFSSRSGGTLTLFINGLVGEFASNSGQVTAKVTVTTSAPTTETSHRVRVLVLEYFPLTPDGQNIDINVTGDVGGSYASVKSNVTTMTEALPKLLSQGSTYRGATDPAAKPSLTYSFMGTKEFDRAVPSVASTLNPSYPFRADYRTIFAPLDICSYVARGMNEVWIWAYQGPHQLDISESKMSGPFGDISNSYRLNDLPQCGRTYTVYTFNYGRDVALAQHSYSHQLEAELSYVDYHLFRDLFEGPNYPATLGVTGRCGSVHNPPNARTEYDWANPTPNPSDCDAWDPNGLGPTTEVSCSLWACADTGGDDPQRLYLVWWMQHFPGRGNTVVYQGRPMRNWWDVHGDFDSVAGGTRSLTLG